MLEVIDKGSLSESHPAPILFVHGGQHATWCWDEHLLDFFAAKGYRAVAVSFRGHGKSPSSKPQRACSIADYVEDVRLVAETLPQTPVVIGHSLGGFVVQNYLELHAAPAAVLVASAPPQGAAAALLRNTGALLRNTTLHPCPLAKPPRPANRFPASPSWSGSAQCSSAHRHPNRWLFVMPNDSKMSRAGGAPN